MVQIGQAELQNRASRALRESIEVFRTSSEEASRTLNAAIAELKTSLENAANRILVLTGFLVILTNSPTRRRHCPNRHLRLTPLS